MEPEVLFLLLCEDVRTTALSHHRIDVLGVITSIRPVAEPAFPVRQPLFCVLAVLTGSKGTGELAIRIRHHRTDQVVFRSARRVVRFVGDPEAVLGVVFRVKNCAFPLEGLYWLELTFARSIIARQRLWLRTGDGYATP